MRRTLGDMVDLGASTEKIGDYAGVTSEAVRLFIDGTTKNPKKATLESYANWIKGEWRKVGHERKTLAGMLRWFAQLVEQGAAIPTIRLVGDLQESLQSPAEGDGTADPLKGREKGEKPNE